MAKASIRRLKPYASREMTLSLERRLDRDSYWRTIYPQGVVRAVEDIGVLDSNDNEVYIVGNPGFGLTRDPSSVYGGRTPNGHEWLVPRAKRRYDGA